MFLISRRRGFMSMAVFKVFTSATVQYLQPRRLGGASKWARIVLKNSAQRQAALSPQSAGHRILLRPGD